MPKHDSLIMPFPLRPDYIVRFVVPVDMTKEEAARLANFIKTIIGAP